MGILHVLILLAYKLWNCDILRLQFYLKLCMMWNSVCHDTENKQFENRVLRRMFEPKREEYQEVGENFIPRSCIIFIVHQTLLG